MLVAVTSPVAAVEIGLSGAFGGMPKVTMHLWQLPPTADPRMAVMETRLDAGTSWVALRVGHFDTAQGNWPVLRLDSSYVCSGGRITQSLVLGSTTLERAVELQSVTATATSVTMIVRWYERTTKTFLTQPFTVTLPWSAAESLRVVANVPLPAVAFRGDASVLPVPPPSSQWTWLTTGHPGYTKVGHPGFFTVHKP
jgi:hypothetical protein